LGPSKADFGKEDALGSALGKNAVLRDRLPPQPGGSSPTHDVRALAKVAVAARPVPTAVDHPAHGLDAKVGVADRPVVRQLRRAVIHVEAVVSGALGDVALQEAVVVLLIDQEPILAASFDPIPADDVVLAAEQRVLDPEGDARPARVDDEVPGNQVAVSVLNLNAVPAPEDAVSGDHVSTAGAKDHGLAIPNEAVACYLIAVVALHQDPLVVAGDQVPLDLVMGRFAAEDASAVAPERVVEDPDVMGGDQEHPVSVVLASGAVSHHASGAAKEPEAAARIPR